MAYIEEKTDSIDPRAGIAMLILINVIVVFQDNLWIETILLGIIFLMYVYSKRIYSGIKYWVVYGVVMLLETYILPNTSELIATSFMIFVNYTRKMLPCLMMGMLMIRTISLKRFVVGMRKMHLPNQLIVAISVTLRYFPAIKEEIQAIKDAMKLRNMHGFEKVEAIIVPLMISATNTAEELSQAAVTRGIENPIAKTSMIELRMKWIDWAFLGAILGVVALLGL